MADEIVGVADSASGAETAPSEAAVETPDATHGDTTQETPETPTDTPDTADPDDDEEAEEPDSPDLSEEEKQTKAKDRRERRKANQQARTERIVEERLAARENERLSKETAAKAEADARAAEATFYEKFGNLVGTPEARAAVSKEIDDLISETIAVNSDNDTATTDDLERLRKAQAALVAKREALQTFDRNAKTYAEINEFQHEHTKRICAAQGLKLPAEHQRAYFDSRDMPELLDRHEAGIVAREAAKAAARVAAVESEWKGKLAREQAAHEATRTGAPGAGPSPNGANGTGNGGRALTPARYYAMSFEDRQQLRSTPEGRAQIDRMSGSPFGTA